MIIDRFIYLKAEDSGVTARGFLSNQTDPQV